MYSFGTKPNTNYSFVKREIPGPGKYETKSFLSETHGAGAFGKDKKDKDLLSKTLSMYPGPGSYRPEEKLAHILRSSANMKFGTSTRNEVNKTLLSNPGPGSYDVDRHLGRSSPSYSLSPKKNDNVKRIKELLPGPGKYNPDPAFNTRSAPTHKFGRSQRVSIDAAKTKLPSPLEYAPKNEFVSYMTKAPAFGFGTSSRPDLNFTKDNPAPGDYTLPSKISEGPGFKMGIRIRDKKRNESPSPGQYNPSIDLMKKAMPKYGIGSAARYQKQREDLPGPGSYDTKSSLPNFKLFKYGKFGNEQREKKIRDSGPGPGSYKIPTKIVEAPRYLLPGADDTFAYV